MFKLTDVSLANRVVVALLTFLIAAAGVVSLTSLKQELYPDFSAPRTTVLTTLPGTSPEAVDELVTLPLARALEDIEDVEAVTSTSSSGVSVVMLTTEFGIDQDTLSADVQSAIDSVATQLPTGAEPEVSGGSLGDLPAMTLTVSSDLSANELSERLEEAAVPVLRGVDGVRDVTISGATGQRITITPDQDALAARGLSSASITQALSTNGSVTPAGSLVEDGGSIAVQVGDEVTSVEDIEELPLTAASGATGAPTSGSGTSSGNAPTQAGGPQAAVTTLGKVAKVEIEDDPITSLTRVNGEPAISLQITATDDADVVAMSKAVNAELDDIEEEIGGDARIIIVSDQAPFISESIEHLVIEGGLGLLFAVLVILVFLRSFRPTSVTALSIPLSLLVTFGGLYLWGYSLNMFTLGALTIAIGRVVDDSIVVIENIKRHLAYGEAKAAAILNGTREVSAAITASTIATVLVFVPIAITGGFVGVLFRPFAFTVATAMLSSLVVALTIVPVLSYWFLKTPKNEGASVRTDEDEDAEPNLIQRLYVPVLRWTLRKPVAVVMAAVILLGGSLALIPRLSVEFLGDTGEETIGLSQSFDSNLTIDEVTRQVADTEDLLTGVDGVGDVVATASLAGAGGAGIQGAGDGASGDTTATYTVATEEGAEVAEVSAALEKAVAEHPASSEISIGAAARGLESSTVDVKITGPDEQALAEAADQVSTALADVPNTSDLTNDLAADQTSVRVEVDRAEAARMGLSEQAIAGIVASAMSPTAATEVTIDGNQLAVYVAGATVSTTDELASLRLGSAGGLTLGDVATVGEVSGPSSVGRSGTDLVATVSLTPAEGELGTVQTEVDERLDALDLPAGVEVAPGGVSEQQSEAFSQLGLAMLVAVGLIFVLLVGILRSATQPFILMLSIPFAAIGAIGLLFVTDTALGVAAMIGMLMLIGIVVTNAIVLMDLINQYRARGRSVNDAILHGAGRRVRPVVMTALATIFALAPMATGITGGSGFISQPLAIVVIGGLLSSTALTLLLVPAIYQMVEGRHDRREVRRQAREQGRRESDQTDRTGEEKALATSDAG